MHKIFNSFLSSRYFVLGIFISCLFLLSNCKKDTTEEMSTINLPEYANVEGREYLLDSIKMKNKTISLIVTYDEEHEEWAQYAFQISKIYLPALEAYLDCDYPHPEHLIINGSDPDADGISGYYSYQYIQSEYTSIEYCGNILHEVCHSWFKSSTFDQKWFYEGSVEFIAYAMILDDLLNIPIVETGIQDQIDSYDIESYGVIDMPLIPNYALENLVSGSQTGFCFSKSVKLQYMLYLELGSEKYRNLQRLLLKNTPVKGDEEILTFLNDIKAKDWKNYYTGWLYEGDYQSVTPNHFWDSDIDGIMDAKEFLIGTSPSNTDTDGDLIPDGYEINNGLDPLQANSISDLITHAPFTDGLNTEWEYLDYLSFTDDDSESGISIDPNYDMEEMKYIIKDDICFFSISLKNEITETSNLSLVVMIDTSLNNDSDFQLFYEFGLGKVGYMYDRNAEDWFYFDAYPNCKQGIQKQVEFQLPLSLLGNSSFQLAPRLKNSSTGDYYDLWVQYELISVK